VSAQAATDACPHCGAELPLQARFCPECGTRLDDPANRTVAVELPDESTGPVPVSMQHAETRWFGIAPPTWLLALAGIALFFAIVLFATSHWPFGLILLGIAALLLAGFMEAAKHRPGREPAPPPSGSRMRERTQSAWEEWRARSAAAAEVRRLQSALLMVESERKRALADLGAAAHARDSHAEAAARAALSELDDQEQFLNEQLDRQLQAAGERIQQARLPVQDTMMVLPTEPNPPEPGPPPGEATPPQPAVVPEPYPPPDEADPPQPARIPEPSPDQPSPDPAPDPDR
jgi:hypothetical protein